jgi:hypothetical protein
MMGDVDDREKLRLNLTRDVLRLLRNRAAREAMPALGPDGSVGVMVVFRDDTMESVLSRAARLGGDVYAAVPPADAGEWPEGMTIVRVNASVPRQARARRLGETPNATS